MFSQQSVEFTQKKGLFWAVFLVALLFWSTVLWAQVQRQDFYLTMDDGVELDAALFEPTATPPDSGFPGVVLVHGLGGDKEDMADAARLFVLGGYVALSYSVRGQGQSGGLRTFSGERERKDLRTVLEWLAARDNVNGRRLGVLGGSQGGQHAWWAALYGLPVRAVAAAAGYVGDLTSNGCIETAVLGVLTSQSVRYGPLWGKVADWVLEDAFDSLRVALPKADTLVPRVRVPVFLSLAYRDWLFAVNEGLRQFDLLQCPKRLQLGTGFHGAPESSVFTNTLIQFVLDWFRRWLKDDTGFDPAVDSMVVYHTDGDWAPHKAHAFPPGLARPVTFYLAPGGRLTLERPERPERVVVSQELLDPNFTARTAFSEGFGPGTVRQFSQQTASFVSEPFNSDVTWAGAPACTLRVAWQGKKMQLHLQFFDVDTAGTWFFLQRGNVAVREANQKTTLRFAAQAYAHTFPAGHRLGVRLVPIDYVSKESVCYAVPFFTSFTDTVYLGGWEPTRVTLPLLNFTSTSVAVNGPRVPNMFWVSQAWPNPFARRTAVELSLARTEQVEIRVLDVLGRTVRVLHRGTMRRGTHALVWDGKDALGIPVPTGSYLFRIRVGQAYRSVKVRVVR